MPGLFFDNWDTPVFRPPSESGSFILRVTRGCAHNSCTYCNMYRGVKFEKLSDSSYAAPGDILRKSLDELKQLKEAGLTMLYYGMESGDSKTLKDIRKGVTGEQSIEVGKRVRAAGMDLSIMIILGIAGAPGSMRHALATAQAINEIKPTYLSALSLMLYRGSELKAQFERGEFTPLPPYGLMEELKVIIEHLELPETDPMVFRSNHVSNYIRLAATLPRDKDKLLADIDASIRYLKQQKNWDIYNHDWSK
mgnify:CR=1 FL=1